jgi:histidinol-phosphate aminotransferase
MTLSRRAFGRLLGSAGAAAALPLPALADATRPAVATGPVRLSHNENPFGPSPAALEAAKGAFGLGGRYPDDVADELIADIAKHHGVSPKQVVLGAGSGEILKWAAVTFTGPGRPLVQADPTFEALGHHVRTAGGEVRPVPLNERHEHDLPHMAELAKDAALVYVCNPNNPTATITPDAALRPFLLGLPAAATILVDEAYHHYVTSSAYASVMDLVARRPGLIVARTFSKIHGMAGLRCGYAIAGEETIAKLAAHQGWDSVSALTAAAARASLADEKRVVEHRELNLRTRRRVQQEAEKLGYTLMPSEANFVMIDLRRDVTPVIAALKEEGVKVGRRFPARPQHLRVTIGRPDEMERFLAAFRTVMSRRPA